MMIKYIFFFNRSECTKSDMKSYSCNINTFFFYLFKQFLCKMQSCCRCCCRTFMFCIYCLISVFIFQFMCYIWRKRHLSKFIKYFLEYAVVLKSDNTISLFYNINNLTNKFITAKMNTSSYFCLFARLNKNFPCILQISFTGEKQHFYCCSCTLFFTYKSSRNYLCIINNKAVSRIKIINYIPEYFMFYFACIFIKDHKP